MKIAILGSRGIPVNYGGFETIAEVLSTGLVMRGHDVTIYCSKAHTDSYEPFYHGVRRIFLPSIKGSPIEKPLFTLLSLLHASFKTYDVILMLGISVSALCFIPRIFRKKVVINVDGLEWQRKKWGPVASLYLRLSERMAGITTDAVITDSEFIRGYYREKYQINPYYIPYGADVSDSVPDDSLRKYGLESGGYILQSCRIEPENNPDLVIEAYLMSGVTLPLVILGDAPEGSRYKQRLLRMAGDRVRFLGFVFGPDYRQIVAHAGLYIHAHEVGGTNPSLLEAMAVGQAPLYLDVPFNREVAGDAGFPFQKDPLSLSHLIKTLSERIEVVRERSVEAKRIIRERYSWDSIIREYERVLGVGISPFGQKLSPKILTIV